MQTQKYNLFPENKSETTIRSIKNSPTTVTMAKCGCATKIVGNCAIVNFICAILAKNDRRIAHFVRFWQPLMGGFRRCHKAPKLSNLKKKTDVFFLLALKEHIFLDTSIQNLGFFFFFVVCYMPNLSSK